MGKGTALGNAVAAVASSSGIRELSSRSTAVASAVEYLSRQRVDLRRTADGHGIGLQASLRTTHLPGDGIALYDLLSGMSANESLAESTFQDDPAREVWAMVSELFRKKLGFQLEPELFSNMLFVAVLGDSDDPTLQSIAQLCLSTFKDTDANGLYHFFLSLGFSCDLDCTGVAARARLVSGDIDPRSADGGAALRRITDAILRSAGTRDLSAEENVSHGKQNGPLQKLVFKVYPDDHVVHPPSCDRGLKNNPVVVVNCLFPVLTALRHGIVRATESVALLEYFAGEPEPRTSEATVAEILATNVRYASRHLTSGEYREGCRYYASPDAFLCFYSECVREFPQLFDALDAGARALGAAIDERRNDDRSDPATNPRTSLNAAFRAIACTNIGKDASVEHACLLEQQSEDGSWQDPDCLYTLGSDREVHFRSPLVTAAFAISALSTGEDSGIRARATNGALTQQREPLDDSLWITTVLKRVAELADGR